MRALLVLVPAALVGGYIVDTVADRHQHAHPAPEPIVANHDVSVDLDLAWVEELVQSLDRELRDLDAQTVEISGSADASVKASLEAAVEVLQSELARAELGPEAAAARVSVAGSLLASVAATLEGTLEIQTDDGRYILITTPDGIRLVAPE